jgi:hypothetical protein
VNERDRTQPEEPNAAAQDAPKDRTRIEDPVVAPNPEAMGGIPVTMAPAGAPVPLVTPVAADPKETRRLAIAVAVGIAVMLLIVALIVWI